MKMYEVGGCVRDEILGVTSKDIDFTVVLENDEQGLIYERGQEPFDFMANRLTDMGFKIFLETPEYLTVRAQFPGKGYTVEHTDGFYRPYDAPRYKGLTADFVLARSEGEYKDGRRPTEVTPGTLEDDLARRDFTMNAIAKDVDGTLIDPFDGQVDIKNRLIRTVGDPMERFSEDALRALRALRFSVTKGFSIDPSTRTAMQAQEVLDLIRNKISDERKQVELEKMTAFDTEASVFALAKYPRLTRAIFSGSVSLNATMKQRKG